MNASYTFGMCNINSRSVYGWMFECRGVTKRVAGRKTFAMGDTHTKHEQLAVKIGQKGVSGSFGGGSAGPGYAPELMIQFGVRFGGAGFVR